MTPQSDYSQSVVLKPNPRLPLLISGFGASLLVLPLSQWVALVIIIFGFFLLIQSLTLRLEFTSEALVVLQLGRELRRFPFHNWLAWRLFLPGLPGLLYFREEASPHLLPILFDRTMLESQLRLRVGSLETPKESANHSS